MTVHKWSKTADNNDTADSTINWREEMSPSLVNNSARAMMAAIAKYRDDLSASLTTGGSSTAYTLTTNQVFASLSALAGKELTMVPHTTNGASATLNVDGTGAKPLRAETGQALPADVLVAGTPYRVTYFSATQEFIVHGVTGSALDALTSGNSPDLVAIEALSGTGALRRTGDGAWALDTLQTAIVHTVDRAGNVLTTGVIGDVQVPFACTILGWTLLADQAGSIVIDIWKDTFANAPPTVADTITGSAKPTLTAAVKATSTTLTGWTTTIAANDVLRFNVDSVSTITRIALMLNVKRFG
ncbi:MAG TPA: hypothetical protein VNK52_16040 [Hyphomicrobiaceae bacterium]|nr:hypothetical protein [Hyphomicrobiaceae bacterium]